MVMSTFTDPLITDPFLFGGLKFAELKLLSCPGRVTYAQPMSIDVEDSALMLRYRDGDVAAFESLYRRHKDPLYRYLIRLSSNKDAAEDVFQEVWGKIIKARRNYRPTAKFSTFLYRVAHNCFIDYVRRNQRHNHTNTIEADSHASEDDEPEALADQAIARQRMHDAVLALPEEQREVFLLYEEAGLTLDVIAKVTGVNHETTKSRFRYAVAKLKRQLSEPQPDLESKT
jgi:RNA polymerase sigma-70 factor (ECF subfamily)